jgi:hypothetical protein
MKLSWTVVKIFYEGMLKEVTETYKNGRNRLTELLNG